MTWTDFFWGAVELATDILPGGKTVKRLAKTAVGGWKDFRAGTNFDFDGLSSDIGDLKNGLAGAKAQIETQGKELQGKIDEVKSELQNQLSQQEAKFDQDIKNLDAKIASLQGEQKKQAEEQKLALQRQKEELTRNINEVERKLTEAQNNLQQELDDLRNEVNERFAQQEQKILNNKRKIEEERLQREEEIRETHSKIKLTNANLENLRKEKEELADQFLNHQAKINQQTAETQQAFEDLETEYSRKTKIIEEKLADNEELLNDFQDDLLNVKHEQAQAKLEREEILEELAEQSDLLHFQKHQLNLVSQQMEDISEEIHGRMGKIQKDHNQLFSLATDTSQKLSNLTDQVNSISQKTAELEQQIKDNKQTIEEVKQETQLTNERLDSFIKSQQLLDFSAEEQTLNKITKSLELKAEETKLLATFKLLQETKKLITPKPQEKNWKVGVKEGRVNQDYPKPEGFMLAPNSWWERKFTGDKVKPKNPYSLLTPEWFQWEEENYLPPEETKLEWGERINHDNESAPLTTQERRAEQQISAEQSIDEKTTEESEKELIFEQLEDAKTELLTRLQEIQEQIQQNLTSVEKTKLVTNSQPQAKPTPTNFIEELEQKSQEQQENLKQDKQEELINEWESIQQISQQVLAENEEEPELDVNKKLEELTQQLQELEQKQVAHQKQMSKWMLFMIIFLLEYVIYKKNGVLGLVILNVILAILYYKKDTILSYRHLWEKYFLIIGYVLGNALAYSAPENQKYKWSSVIAFNLIVLGIYAYTLYQQKQEQAKLEAEFQEKTAEICQEHNITSQEWKTTNIQPNLLSDYSAFSNSFVATKEQQLTNLQQIIHEQEIIHQKTLELQQQSELLQQSAQIESNLKEIHANLGESNMSWSKIKQRYPDFAERSVLLKELSSLDRILKKEQAKSSNSSFLNKLNRMAVISNEENTLLSQLHLTIEQFIAISTHAARFSKEEKEYLSDNYANLNIQQQLSLLNAGLNSLGIDSLEKKEIFIDLNHQLYNEKNSFGLSVKEKENILRLLVNTLNLTPEQQNYLENMGISFFNASEWHIDNTQKNHLLSFGLQRINLNENQQQNLLNLSSDRLKTFSLSEDQKNILQSLAPLTRKDKYSEASLQLLNSLHLAPNSLSFFINEEILPNPQYDFGKETSVYLPLKTKFLLGEQKVLETKAKIEKKKQRKEELEEQKFSIVESLGNLAREKQEKNEELYHLTYSLEEWVSIGVLKEFQKDILLTLGLKTIPQYNFFELAIFAIENFCPDDTWKKELEISSFLREEYQKYLTIPKKQPNIKWGKTLQELRGNFSSLDQQELEVLINKKIQELLSNYQPKASEEEIITNSDQEEEIIAETPQPSTSRYDDLLNTLNAEDQGRQRKKQEREEAKKKFEESERLRRENKLSEKDKKLKEEAERREQEKLLQEQEEQKRREAEEIRAKALQEEQERIFNQKLKNIEETKRRAEKALENQKKANDLSEQKKKDEIKKLEEENKLEQEHLAKQAQLIEEEKQKKLNAIVLEDQEQRQRIEREANAEKARILQEANDKKRKNEAELKKKENALLKEKQERQIEIDKTQREIALQNTLAEELKQLGKRQEDLLKGRKNQQQALQEFRQQMYDACLDYPWMDSETRSGTENPTLSGWGNLRTWLNSYPNLRFNLHRGDIASCNWSGWPIAMKTFARAVGNKFVTKEELRQYINNYAQSLNCLD